MGTSTLQCREIRHERIAAVVRAIELMRAGLERPLSLSLLAKAALFSPFHFHRVFCEITAVTPARFLAALRMAEAKRLLLHSSMSVVDVSAMVGYESPGTFSTQFTRLVGIAPARFRLLARRYAGESVQTLLSAMPPRQRLGEAAEDEGGRWIALSGAVGADSVVVGGLFPVGSVRERPGSWIVADGSAPVRAARVAGGGEYRASTVVVDAASPLGAALVDQVPGSYLTGAARIQLAADPVDPAEEGGAGPEPIRVALRAPRITDPPLLAVTPLRWLADGDSARPTAQAPTALVGLRRTPGRWAGSSRTGAGSGRRSAGFDPAAGDHSRTVTVALAA